MYSEYDQIDLFCDDCFGTKNKAELIIKLLENKSSIIYQNKMIALYGKWGSGKSTVLKTVLDHTKECEFLFFEAWKYESDEDLSLSLLHMIIERIESNKGIAKNSVDNLKRAAKTLFKFSYNLLMTTEANLIGIQLNPGQAGKETIEQMSSDTSYYNKVKKFEELFREAIDTYVNQNKKPLVILIDDLDRCEPDNVLSLLSHVKHLFTSKEIIYICAIDKNAVENSINIKYGKNIDYLEYLDKIFHFNINMPSKTNLSGIVEDFQSKYGNEFISDKTKWLIVNFFEHVKIDNPRKIRRVLSKLSILKDISPESKLISVLGDYNIDSYSLVQWLITIIIFEFYPDYYNDIINYKAKLERFKNLIFNDGNGINIAANHSIKVEDYFGFLSDNIASTIISNDIIDSFVNCKEGDKWSQDLMQMIFLFMPSDITNLVLPDFKKPEDRKKNLQLLIRHSHLSKHQIAFNYLDFFLTTLSDNKNLNHFKIEPMNYFEFAEKYF